MSSMEWFEERLEQRRAMLAQSRKVRRERQKKAKAIARVALVATLVVLGVLAVNIGRKAAIVMHHAQAIETQRVS